ncbi:hypothetical protein ACN20G_03135 [Streptomyces sp. BI20]|uniref:hypothetical protein n=1 Tax=Streptomyces sp. BI20 TaxID=3403460 RepID=UPI003C73691C
MNSGEGDQYVFYGGEDWITRKGVPTLRVAREDRERLALRFVRPAGYRIAADRVEKPGSVVLLDALPGSGRRAAGIMLLHGLGEDIDVDGDDARFEELPATDDDRETGRGKGELAPQEGDRFLLDLSGIADEQVFTKAQQLMVLRRSQVLEAGAHMVVVLPRDMGHVLSPDLEPHTVTLGRPRGLAVLTRHLRMDRMSFHPADLAGEDLQHLCERSPMRELARLAGLVKIAGESGRFGSDFAEWLDQARHALTDRVDEVGRQVVTVRSAPDRALLLAAAVFEEAPADAVHEAWRGLMKVVGHEEEETTELARTDFGQRLTALGIKRGIDGRLRFDRLAYADAVRTYFWTNFPGIRDDLRDWIGSAAELSALTTDDKLSAVVRFGERSLAAGRPDHLFDLLVRWTDGATGAFRDPRAVATLELGLTHERFGGWFRKRMYDCARSGPLSDGLARVLIDACVQSLGVTHPGQAMVRLHHLAVRNGTVAAEAREALLDLAGRDRRLYGQLIDRLNEGVGRGPGDVDPHLEILISLLDRRRTPDPPPWTDLLAGWETVFAQPPTELWGPSARSWLDAVARGSAPATLLGAIVRATHGRVAALHRLYAVAHGWVGRARDPSREAVAALLWQHIDDEQFARTRNSDTGPRTWEETR